MILIFLLIAIWLTPGGSSTVHVYTQTIHRTTQLRARITQKTTWLEGFLGFEPRVVRLNDEPKKLCRWCIVVYWPIPG